MVKRLTLALVALLPGMALAENYATVTYYNVAGDGRFNVEQLVLNASVSNSGGVPNGTYVVNVTGGFGGNPNRFSWVVTGGAVTSGPTWGPGTNTHTTGTDGTGVRSYGFTWESYPAGYTPADLSSLSFTTTQTQEGGHSEVTCSGCIRDQVPIAKTINMGGTGPHTATWRASVKVNCSTQHALGLTINGVQMSYLVTSIFATKDAPSTISINYSCNSNTIDCAQGKPWILSVDGDPTQSGTISYTGTPADPTYILNVAGKGDIGNPVFFDCAPATGTLALNGDLTIPPSGSGHTLSVKLKGVTVASASSSGGAATTTHVTITKTVDNVANGDNIQWYIDGVLAKQSVVALSCSYNAEMQQTYCTAIDTFAGTASQNASPTPTATPKATPSPTSPPQNPGYTPPPPPTYTPPTAQSTPTGGGDVRVMNPSDIYKPIVDALTVANPGTASRNNSASGEGANFSDRGNLDKIQPELEKAIQKQNSMVATGSTKLNALGDSFHSLPTSLGTVTSLNFGTGYFNGIGGFTGLPTNVDLSPYMTAISLGRSVLLWALTIFFGFLTVRAFTWTQ